MYDSIIKQFPANEIERLIQDNNYFKMLNWNQILQVKDDNIQFQSHGHKHEIHNEYQDIRTITNELTESKQIIENHLNSKVSLFAYPNGNSNEISIVALKNTGYEAAFILKETCYNGVDNKFLIPRFTPKGNKYKFLKQILFT
jgi:peptidoglycan/xylan/chitin deacetylase (PgdA/CDA1 family)